MERKLSSLFLLLVFASAVSAVAPVWIETVGSAHPSDVITVYMMTNLDVFGMDIAAIVDSSTAGPTGVVVQPPWVWNPSFSSPQANPGTPPVLVANITAVTGVGPGATGMLFGFNYHVPDLPYSTIIEIGSGGDWLPWFEFIDGSFYEGQLDSAFIHVVPEPMTIVLLGLGGLLVRRRKK